MWRVGFIVGTPPNILVANRSLFSRTLSKRYYFSGSPISGWMATAEITMTGRPESQSPAEQVAALVAELEQAEAYEQQLRQAIAHARDQLAAGNVAVALSLLNAALSDIDSAADVVAPTRPTGEAK
jgi:hypothetical protein